MSARVRLQRLAADHSGAIMLIGLFMGVLLVAALYYVVGIGQAIAQRERMQDAADAAAFSAAVLHARGMNAIALVNMVMAALLAILIALKLVEALCGIAITLIALSAFFFGPELVAAIPAIAELRQNVRAAHDVLEPEIEAALETLHGLARGIRVVVPAAAQARAVALVRAHYRPPAELGFIVPARAALPTEDAPFRELCDRASGYVGDLVGIALANVVPNPIADAVAEATADLSRSAADWYCGDVAGAAASTHVSQHIRHPTLPARAACIAYDAARDDYDADAHRTLCEQAMRDEQAAEAAARTGLCRQQCAPDGPYAQRVELARSECVPHPGKHLTRFSWVQRELERDYVFHAGAWRLVRSRVIRTQRFQRDTPPCGDNRDAIGKSWSPHEHIAGSARIEPLCSGERALPAGGLEGETVHDVRAVEVLHLLGCREDTLLRRELARPKDLRGTDAEHARSPQRLLAIAQLGEEPFQLRAYVLGTAPRATTEAILRVASWGGVSASKSAAPEQALLLHAATLGRSAFAQAEYYYAVETDAAAERASFLWNMRWQARLRRFRLPDHVAPGVSDDAGDFAVQAAALDAATACERARVASGLDTSCPSVDLTPNDLVIH